MVVAFSYRHVFRSGRIGHFDGFGHVNGNTAKGINKVLKRRERGHQVVIDLDARKALYCIHGLQGIAVHQRVVDFARLARQNRVARDRHQGELIVRRVNAHQRDDVGVLIQLSMVGSLARVQSCALPGIGPDQQHIEGVFVLDHGKLQRVGMLLGIGDRTQGRAQCNEHDGERSNARNRIGRHAHRPILIFFANVLRISGHVLPHLLSLAVWQARAGFSLVVVMVAQHRLEQAKVRDNHKKSQA